VSRSRPCKAVARRLLHSSFHGVSKEQISKLIRAPSLARPRHVKWVAEDHVERTLEERKKDAKGDLLLETQFGAGRLYAAISSRPGQLGRANGYILEGKELEVRPLVTHLHLSGRLTPRQFYIRELRAGKHK
jgi:Ribosomal protein S8e